MAAVPLLEALQYGAALTDQMEVHAAPRDDSATLRRGVVLGDFGLMFPHHAVAELLDPAPPLHVIPHTPEWFSGVVNVRGNIVPTFDLNSLLGGQANDGDDCYMFAYGQGDATAAFFIHQLPQLMRLDPASKLMQNSMTTTLDAHIQGGYLIDGFIWVDMQMEPMFDALSAMIIQG